MKKNYADEDEDIGVDTEETDDDEVSSDDFDE